MARIGTLLGLMAIYAFIVGLERYQAQPKPIPSVPYAEADATAMRQALEQLGIPAANIVFLLSAQATKTSFESRFKAAISSLTETDSFISFSPDMAFPSATRII